MPETGQVSQLLSRFNPFDGDEQKQDETQFGAMSSRRLTDRRPDALVLAPIDTSVQQQRLGLALSPDSGVDVNDGPTAASKRPLKSIDVGFTDLSYTVKVWRYGKLHRGEYDELVFIQLRLTFDLRCVNKNISHIKTFYNYEIVYA